MSELKLQDYIQYYIGGRCLNTWFPEDHEQYNNNWILEGYVIDMEKPYCLVNKTNNTWTDSIKPILRKLEDMTDDECMVVNEISPFFTKGTSERYIRERLYCIRDRIMYLHLIPEVFHYTLKQGFDLFSLIENGLAIDSKTLK